MKRLTVNEIIDRAALYYGADRPNGNTRAAISRYIREYLTKLELERSGKSYSVPSDRAENIIKYDLRGYFAKKFARNGFDPAIQAAEEDQEEAKASLASQRTYWESYDPQQEQEGLEHGRLDHSRNEVPEAQFNSMLLRALTRAIFPRFNEAAFRHDFGQRESLLTELQHPPKDAENDPYMIRLSMEHRDLSKKLDPALEFGDLSAYLTLNREGEK